MPGVTLAYAAPDTIVLCVVALFAIRGAMKGFVWTLVRTTGLLAGFFLAARFDTTVGTFLAAHLSFVPAASSDMVGWVAIVVAVYVFATVAAHVLRGAVRDVKLGDPDRVLGAVLGAALGLGICAFSFTLWASTKSKEVVRATFSGSIAAVWMAKTVQSVTPFFPDGVRARWAPVLSSLD